MSEYTDELDYVFDLLQFVDLGAAYDDETGNFAKEYNYHMQLPMSDVDGGAVNEYDAAKEYFAPLIIADYEALLATNPLRPEFTTEGINMVPALQDGFKIRLAVLYRREVELQDAYEYTLTVRL